MALEELQTTVNKLTFNIFGSETDRKVGGFLFDEKVEWATSRELHGLAALTFNEQTCAGVMTIISKALEPKDNTWRTLHKAVKLLHHFVVYGAERCVDHAWDRQRQVESLRRYNSAIHGRTGTLNGGGTDFGAPVRKAAEELDELLKDSEGIRAARAQERAPDALLPLGDSDDYSAPVQAKAIDLGNDDAFGVVPQGSVGARFDLQQVPGLYEGRPDRYFDNLKDPRKRSSGVEDSDHTRQAQAADLLDLDIDEAQPASVPDAHNLVKAGKEAALQKQLLEQQRQLEQLKAIMLSKVQQGGTAGAAGTSGAGSSGGGGGGAPADKVMQAFGSMGLGGNGGMGAVGQTMPNAAMQQQGMNAGGGGGGLMGGVGAGGGGLGGLGMGGLKPQPVTSRWQAGAGQRQQAWQGGPSSMGGGVGLGQTQGLGLGTGMQQQGSLGVTMRGGMMSGMGGGQNELQGGGLSQQFQGQQRRAYGRPNTGGDGGAGMGGGGAGGGLGSTGGLL